jgi:hypothetical protein
MKKTSFILFFILLSSLRIAERLRAEQTLPAPTTQSIFTAEEHEKRSREIEQFVRADLAKHEAQLAVSTLNVSSRDLSHAALAYLMLGEGADKGLTKAEANLELLFKYQNMDSSSPEFGKIPWNPSKPDLRDDNAIEFTASALAPLFLLYADRFPKTFVNEAEPHLRAVLVAISHHSVHVPYTNIALMKLTNQILLGEYLNDPAAVDAGKAMLAEWIAYTRVNGIAEFDSPTYSQTQLSVLDDLYHNVREPQLKAKAKVILDYYWTELSANFFPGSRSLGGPYSRTYDFLAHDFNLSQVYYLNGIPAQALAGGLYLNDEVQVWIAAVWNDYTPPASALTLASEPTRLIVQRFGPRPGEDRTNYITPDFAIGSASHLYGPQDRLVSASLASAKDLPCISIVPDVLDAPYGKIATLDKGVTIRSIIWSSLSRPCRTKARFLRSSISRLVLALIPSIRSRPMFFCRSRPTRWSWTVFRSIGAAGSFLLPPIVSSVSAREMVRSRSGFSRRRWLPVQKSLFASKTMVKSGVRAASLPITIRGRKPNSTSRRSAAGFFSSPPTAVPTTNSRIF